jgi:hypothetical protein
MPWYPHCCCRYCPHCREGFGPAQWQVVIDGLANSAPVDCPECGDLNGTYVLDWAGGLPWYGGVKWEYELPAAVCGVVKLQLLATAWGSFPTLYDALELQLLDADGNTMMYARTTFPGGPPDCLAADGHALGSLNLLPGTTTCSVANSTAHVTALRPCGEEE